MGMHTNYIGIMVVIVEVFWICFIKTTSKSQRNGIDSRNDGNCTWLLWTLIYDSMGVLPCSTCQEKRTKHKRTYKHIQHRLMKEWTNERGDFPNRVCADMCDHRYWDAFAYAQHDVASTRCISAQWVTFRADSEPVNRAGWNTIMGLGIMQCNQAHTEKLVPENRSQVLQNKGHEKFVHEFLHWWKHVDLTTLYQSLIRNGAAVQSVQQFSDTEGIQQSKSSDTPRSRRWELGAVLWSWSFWSGCPKSSFTKNYSPNSSPNYFCCHW